MLGRVINCLTDGKSQFIPYRDSKLTRILQESLGGNSKTCLIITASPSMYNSVETLSTCRFGMRAKSIKNNAKVNKQLTVAELKVIVTRLEKELEIKGRRVLQLEQMIISLGGTIPKDDENIKALEESDASTIEEPKDIPEEKTAENTADIKKPSEEIKDAKTATEIKEEKKTEVVVIKVIEDKLDQQRSLEKVSDLEKQKEEQRKDLDTIIEQLRQERKLLKVKDGKLILLKQQLSESMVELERYQRENNALIKNAVDLKLQIHELEDQISDKVI